MVLSSPTQIPPPVRSEETVAGDVASDNPFGSGVNAARGGANLYGAFSMETFCDVGGLSLTHEDAGGFLDYVRQFNAPNFWYQDANVRVWAYQETYDNWQDTYGMDAVKAVYHSGHGGMDGNGVFYAPMGSAWAGNDCTAISSDMRLGNEHVKYIFWSTCLSCRVLDGHSPIRTWQPANLGFRMLFGFETISWDNGDYGKFFWEEWRKGKSLSQAWLDSSWRIAHDQAPSAVAVGANAEEATDRLYNERFFDGNAASTNWWQWRWYYATSATRQPMMALSSQPLVAQLRPFDLDASKASTIATQFGIDVPRQNANKSADGSFRINAGDKQIYVGATGSFDVQLAKADFSNRQQLSQVQAHSLAEAAIRQYGLSEMSSLVADRVLLSYGAGGTDTGSGQRDESHVTGTVVQFRQTINRIPVISQDGGTVRVSIDNAGTITNIHSSLRMVDALTERSRLLQPAPKPPGGMDTQLAPEPDDYEKALAANFNVLLTRWAASGKMPIGFFTVPNSTEIGYDIRGGEAILIARRAVEVDFGNGYRKRYWTTALLG